MQNAAWQLNAARASRLLAAMANPKRLAILCLLVDGERSVGGIADSLAVRQSTVSQHLALLKQGGFVTARRNAQSLYYSLASDEARSVLETLTSMYCDDPSRRARGTRQ
jgi:DNA-binding transcriptional ArsR family regulator